MTRTEIHPHTFIFSEIHELKQVSLEMVVVDKQDVILFDHKQAAEQFLNTFQEKVCDYFLMELVEIIQQTRLNKI
jgi:hypothetical protein